MVAYSWTCSCCGRQFNELPTCWSTGVGPDPYHALDDEQKSRSVLTPDFCVIEDSHFFVRGHIALPIIGQEEHFAWDVWISVSKASFDVIIDTLEDEDRWKHGPFFGWLCSWLPYEPMDGTLKTNVHLGAPGKVFFIEVEPTDHPLAVEQREGISIDRVVEIAERLMPRH